MAYTVDVPLLLGVLKFIAAVLLGLGGLVVYMMLGYLQATWGMSPEEKKDFDKYIEENGIMGADDDNFPL